MKKLLTLLLTAILTLTLTSCSAQNASSSDPSAGTAPAAPASTPVDNGKYLGVMLTTSVTTLDTTQADGGESFEVIANCIDGLTQLDSASAVIPAIAETWDTSPDGLTYTFHLRDAQWSNGDPVTASDFVFAWRLNVETNKKYGYLYGANVGSIKNADAILSGSASPDTLGVSAPDDKTLVVNLTVPVSYFPSLMSFPTFYPINESFYRALEPQTYATTPETYLSNGAFLLESYTPGDPSITLKRNPGYWDAARVCLTGISYQVVGSSENALGAFKRNVLDVVTISGEQVSSAESDASLSARLSVTGSGCLWYLAFNQAGEDGKGLSNANLRLAITNAIDREALVDACVMDGSLPTYTAVPPQFAANASTGEDFSGNQGRYSTYCAYDVSRARSSLDAAKSELETDNFELTLLYGSDEGDEVAKVAAAVRDQLEENLPGVSLTLQPMTKEERLEKMQTGDYDIALTRWGPDYADPMTYLGMWVTGNANNYGGWSNAAYDKLITDCTSGACVTDYNARWATLHEAEALVMQEAVIAPLYTKVNANLIASGVTGIEFHPVALNRVYKSAVIE